MTDYQPLSCDLHDELELAAMRGIPVRLYWREGNGPTQEAIGIIRDIQVRSGEEFLVFEINSVQNRIRLDNLLPECFPLESKNRIAE